MLVINLDFIAFYLLHKKMYNDLFAFLSIQIFANHPVKKFSWEIFLSTIHLLKISSPDPVIKYFSLLNKKTNIYRFIHLLRKDFFFTYVFMSKYM